MLVQAWLSVQQVCVWVTRVIAGVDCYRLIFCVGLKKGAIIIMTFISICIYELNTSLL